MKPIAISMVLLCAALARADDKPAADALRALGADVRLDKAGAVVAVTVRESEKLADEHFKLIAGLAGLKNLTFYGKSLMTDEQAAVLAKLPALETLAANGTKLTDKGFAGLAGLKTLKKLTLWHLGWSAPGKQTDGSGFGDLASLPALESFNFAGSTVTDAGLEAVSKATQLRELTFYHCRATDAGLAHLKKMPHLKSVYIGPQFSMRMGDAGVVHLAECAALESLTVNETTLTYAGSLKLLKNLKNLKTLKLEKTAVSDADMAALKADLPGVAITWTKPEPADVERMKRAMERKPK